MSVVAGLLGMVSEVHVQGLMSGRCGPPVWDPASCLYSFCCGKQLCFTDVFVLLKRALFFRLAIEM